MKAPIEYAEFAKFKRIISDLFVHYTGAPVMNIRKTLIKKVMNGTPMIDCMQAMKVIRRFCERTILFDDAALGDACYVLQDWEGSVKWKQDQP